MIVKENQETIEKMYMEYAAKERLQDLLPILKEKIISDPDGVAFYYYKIGEIYAEHLHKIENAQEYFQKSIDREQYIPAFESLRSLYLAQENLEKYLQLTEQQLSHTSSLQEQVDLRISLAEIYFRQENMAKAEEHWQTILQINPDHRTSMTRLSNLYKAQENWEKYVQIQENTIRFLKNQDEISSLYLELANIYIDKLNKVEEAFHNYTLAHEQQTNNLDIVESHYALAKKVNNIAQIIYCLEEKIKLQPSFELWMELGKYHQDIKEQDKAVIAYQHAWELKPTHWEAGDAIIQIYRQEGNYHALYPLLVKKSNSNLPNSKKLPIYAEIADIAFYHLKKRREALRYYTKILDLQPENKNAFLNSLEIYEQENNWQDQLGLYEKMFAFTSEEFSAQFLVPCKNIYEAHYPHHRNLEKIYIRLWDMTQEFSYLLSLEALYKYREEYVKLANILETKLPLLSTKQEKSDLLADYESLHLKYLVNPTKLFWCYEQYMELDSKDVLTLRKIAQLHLQQQDYKKSIETWNQIILLTKEQKELAEIYHTQGIIFEEFLHDDKNAQQTFEQALQQFPLLKTIYHLEILYKKQNNIVEWLQLLENTKSQFPVQEQIQIKFMIALIQWKQQNNTEIAKQILEKLLQEHGYQSNIFLSLSQLYQIDDVEKQKQLYETYIPLIEDDSEKVNHLFILGTLYTDKDKAAAIYSQILQLQKNHIPALKSLQTIYESQQNWTALVETYLAELDMNTTSLTRCLILHLRCANLFIRLNRQDLAIEHFQKVLKDDVKNRNAIRGLQNIYREQQNDLDLTTMLLQELNYNKESNRNVDIHKELAELYKKEGKISESIKHLTQAHKYCPYSIEINSKRNALLQQDEQWEEYYLSLEEELEWNDSPEIHQTIIQLALDKLQDQTIAQKHLEILLHQNNITLEQRTLLQSIYQEQNNKENAKNFIQLYTLQLAETEEETKKADLHEQIGILYLNSLGDIDNSVEYFKISLQVNPKQRRSFQALSKIYIKKERWEELAELYGERSWVLENKEQENLLLKAGSIYVQKVNKTDKAFYYYQRAFLLYPDNYYALRGMRRILESNKEWFRLVDILYKEAELVAPENKANVYLKIANIWENELLDPYRAGIAYLKMLESNFHIDIARKILPWFEDANDFKNLQIVLEKILEYDNLSMQERNEHTLSLAHLLLEKTINKEKAIQLYQNVHQNDPKNMTAVKVLENIYQQENNWEQWSILLERKLENLQNTSELQKTHLQLAKLFHYKLYDERKAILHYEFAWNLEEKQHTYEILTALKQLYLEWGEYRKYIDISYEELKLIHNDALHISILENIAQVWENKLHEEEQAIATYEDILLRNDRHEATRQNLIRLYSKKYDNDNVLRIYDICLKSTKDTQEYIKIALMMSHIAWYNQGNYATAVENLQKILAKDKTHQEALQFLEKIATQTQDTTTIIQVLTQQISLCSKEEDKFQLHHRIAELQLEESRWNNAIEQYQAALTIKPNDVQTLRTLLSVYNQMEDHEKIIETTLHILALTDKIEDKAKFNFEIARLYSSQDRTTAIQYLLRVLSFNKNHVPALQLLTYLYIQIKDWENLLKYTTHWLDMESKNTFLPLYRHGLALYSLDKKIESVPFWEQAWKIQPNNEELTWQLVNLYYELQDWEKVKFYGQALFNDPFPTEHHYERLGLAAEYIGETDIAVLYYQKGLSIFPQHVNMLFHCADIQFNTSQWESALFYYVQLFSNPDVPPEKKQFIQLRLAQIKDNIGMKEGALEGFENVLEKDPQDTIALERAGYLYLEKNQPLQALEKWIPLIPLLTDAEKRKNLQMQIAQIQENIGRYKDAILSYEKNLENNPRDQVTLYHLIQLTFLEQQLDKNKEYVHILLQEDITDLERADLYLHLGKVAQKSKEDALPHFKKAYEILPQYLPCVRAIAQVYKEKGQFESVIELYNNFLQKIPAHHTDRIPILLDYAKILSEHLGQRKETIALYEELLQLAPDHENTHILLANLYKKYPEKRDQAIQKHRYLLEQNPYRVASYHELFLLYLQENEYDKAYLCTQALEALDKTLPKEKKLLEQVADRVPSGWMDENMFQSLLPPNQQTILYEIMALVDSSMEKVYPQYTETKYKLRIIDKLNLDSGDSVSDLINKLMTYLRIPELAVYTVDNNYIGLENSQPPILYIGKSYLQTLSNVQLTFMITQTLYYVSQNHIMAQKMTSQDYKEYVQLFVENFAKTGNQLTKEQDNIVKKITYFLPKKIQKQLEDRMDLLTKIYQADTKQFQTNLEKAAIHCAILFTNSLKESIQLYATLHGMGLETMKQQPTTKEMFQFYLSEEHQELRKELGLSIQWLNY
ncbi:MAG TPA: hypothetical protein PLB63_01770 [Planctomycetota bacterium]|nr:hypothetical protein [Planctomycetota bacterium]HQA99672.1 hypothetical protein [Planctomycetota bacterium]